MSKNKIFVTGDVAIDWFEITEPPRAGVGNELAPNWRRQHGVIRHMLPGGAMLLAEFTKNATGMKPYSPRFYKNKKPSTLTREQIVVSEVALAGSAPYFVSTKKGFSGPPDGGKPLCLSPGNKIIDYPVDASEAAVVIIDDPGNGFRNSKHLFPQDVSRDAMVLYKTNAPLMQGESWQWLQTAGDPEKTVVLIDANDLRMMPEINISRALSWERTSADFVEHISLNPHLRDLRRCANLVVLFDTDGAILYQGTENGKVTLIYDPKCLEGHFRQTINGDVLGKTALFAAVLAASLYKDGIAGLADGIKRGLSGMRHLLRNGYALEANKLHIPYNALFSGEGEEIHVRQDKAINTYAEVLVRRNTSIDKRDSDLWTILDEKTSHTRELIAANIVRCGRDATLDSVPEIKFGKLLKTIDRSEIESYSGIAKLMQEYLDNPKPERPLSFAVFGAPGAGKSFGVKQIAKGINEKNPQNIKDTTYNISQFSDYRDLVNALHKTRDTVLAGDVPLIFFDEFDSRQGDKKLGWLKYFLAPMQDGEFLDGESIYHIGKAIFVFAGGTCSSFEEFSGEQQAQDKQSAAPDEEYLNKLIEDNKSAKLPDFVSRLKGFVNIKGPSPQCARTPEGTNHPDEAFILRRAKILRSMFEKAPTTKLLFDGEDKKGVLNIDDGVLRALLKIPNYKHGNRSMESIIEMCQLSGRKIFDKAALPPREQLKIHVDTDVFFEIVEKDRFTSPADCVEDFIKNEKSIVERLAEEIHKDYIRNRKLKKHPINVPEEFKDLPEHKKASNRHAAEDIPRKMRAINMGIRKVTAGRFPQTPIISDGELEVLAAMEHERWLQEQTRQGYRYGKIRDDNAKTNPNMVAYDDLDPETKHYDLEAVTSIPMVLAACGFELYRMEEKEELHDPNMIEILARLQHADYVENRKKKGETPADNPSMRPFDDLSESLKHSNIDSASHIPSKLKAIGYGIRPVKPGQEPVMPGFTDGEIETMACIEHDRWNWERRLQGWSLKEGGKDEENKTTPHLIPYAALDDEIKEYDRETVRLIPQMLSRAGYEAYALPKKK